MPASRKRIPPQSGEYTLNTCPIFHGHLNRTVNHGAGEYVDGDCHVNGIEGFWARLKLSIRGTHVHVSAKHLQKYVKEFEYRYNRRKRPDAIFGDLVASF